MPFEPPGSQPVASQPGLVPECLPSSSAHQGTGVPAPCHADTLASGLPGLPPLLSPGAEKREPESAGTTFRGRLHPLTLFFAGWNSLKSFLVPIIAVGIFGRGDGMMHPLFWAFLAIPVYSAVVRYFTFTYRLEGGDLITRHGLISRHERHIPLTRVQDIRIEQGVLHRLFGVVDAQVETGAGEGPEASLAVLSRAEAERLRRAVFEHLPARAGAALNTAGPSAAPSAPEVIRRINSRELVLEGLTSNRMASVLVVFAVGFGFIDDFVPRERFEQWIREGGEVVTRWGQRSGEALWLTLAVLAVAGVLASVGISILGSIVLFHGFTLTRRGEDLQRTYGLLRQRSSNLPRRRIQLLKVEESLLRRWLRLARIRADTASGGSNDEESKSGRDVLLPIVRREELRDLLPQLLPGLDSDTAPWRQVSRRAIRRGAMKGAIALLLLTTALVVAEGLLGTPRWRDAWPLLLLPAVYWLNVIGYRHLGYAAGRLYFQTRRGWLGRVWHIVPLRNTQALVVGETPFDRRHGVVTLHLDTAGQAQTGGAPELGNLPRGEALALARSLARVAATTRYRWR